MLYPSCCLPRAPRSSPDLQSSEHSRRRIARTFAAVSGLLVSTIVDRFVKSLLIVILLIVFPFVFRSSRRAMGEYYHDRLIVQYRWTRFCRFGGKYPKPSKNTAQNAATPTGGRFRRGLPSCDVGACVTCNYDGFCFRYVSAGSYSEQTAQSRKGGATATDVACGRQSALWNRQINNMSQHFRCDPRCTHGDRGSGLSAVAVTSLCGTGRRDSTKSAQLEHSCGAIVPCRAQTTRSPEYC